MPDAPMRRGPEHRVPASPSPPCSSSVALMGTINLFVDGVLRDGALRWVYGTTMALCMLGRGSARRPEAGQPVAHVRAGPAR